MRSNLVAVNLGTQQSLPAPSLCPCISRAKDSPCFWILWRYLSRERLLSCFKREEWGKVSDLPASTMSSVPTGHMWGVSWTPAGNFLLFPNKPHSSGFLSPTDLTWSETMLWRSRCLIWNFYTSAQFKYLLGRALFHYPKAEPHADNRAVLWYRGPSVRRSYKYGFRCRCVIFLVVRPDKVFLPLSAVENSKLLVSNPSKSNGFNLTFPWQNE